jgi:inorganic pyrophosphatase
MHSLEEISPWSGPHLRVIVETPRGSTGKFTYDPKLKLFGLTGILSMGMHFPYDFGFVPSTLGGDGDPLDALVLNDALTGTGCLLETRLVGVLRARQTLKTETEENDRLIAVETNSTTWEDIQEVRDLPAVMRRQIEHYFVSYNAVKGKKFRPLGWKGPAVARRIVRKGCVTFLAKHHSKMEK